MAKDAYWFSHDCNAKDDPKCMLLIDQLGLEGYGIYWVLIETLRDQNNYRYPLKLVPILAKRFFTSAEKMMAVVKSYDLFTIENEEFFYSESLLTRMLHLDTKREKNKQAALVRWNKNNANAMQTHSECNAEVMLSKVKETKLKNIDIVKKFYDSEIEKCNDENYKKMVNFIFGENPLKKPLEKVITTKEQISYNNFCNLMGIAKMNKRSLLDTLLDYENYTARKYTSVYLTVRKWMQK
jgi:hypothetical protein